MGSGGTVAYHTITGMAALDELIGRREADELKFAVWPFEDIGDGHVLVESYPALHSAPADWGPCRGADERGAWKVLVDLVRANRTGDIGRWFDVPRLPFGRVEGVSAEEQVTFEGFMFGLR